jgi:hypothetical protein
LSGTGLQAGAWVNTAPYVGNTIFASTTHGTTATQSGNDSARLCIVNSSGNGYSLWLSQAGTTARIYLVVAGTLTTQLVEFTGYGTGYSQIFELRCTDKTTGTFKFLRNGSQVGSDLVDTTYTGLDYAGCTSTGGRGTGMTVGAIFDVLTLSNPIVSGSAFSGTCVGATDGAGTMTVSSLVVPITFTGGGTAFSGTFPAPVDDTAYPVMNSASLNFTIASGANSKVVARPFNAPAGTAVTQFGIVIDTDPLYLGYPFDQAGNPLITGEYVYAELPSPAVIDPDSRIRDFDPGDLPYTTTLIIHRTNGKTYLHDMTFTASGVGPTPTPSENGLTSHGLTSVGLTSTGLTSVGL